MSATLTPKQQALYSAATEADKRFRRVKLEAHAEAQRIVDQAIAQARTERDTAVRRAFDQGVRKSFFRRKDGGLHTTNPGAIDEILRATGHLAELDAAVEEAVQVATGGARYEVDGDGYLVVTPPREEVDELVRRMDFDPETVVPYSARFALTQFGKLDPVDGVVVPGTYDLHPVVKWAQQSEKEAEAVAWFREHGA